jgi:hypothetical protein
LNQATAQFSAIPNPTGALVLPLVDFLLFKQHVRVLDFTAHCMPVKLLPNLPDCCPIAHSYHLPRFRPPIVSILRIANYYLAGGNSDLGRNCWLQLSVASCSNSPAE